VLAVQQAVVVGGPLLLPDGAGQHRGGGRQLGLGPVDLCQREDDIYNIVVIILSAHGDFLCLLHKLTIWKNFSWTHMILYCQILQFKEYAKIISFLLKGLTMKLVFRDSNLNMSTKLKRSVHIVRNLSTRSRFYEKFEIKYLVTFSLFKRLPIFLRHVAKEWLCKLLKHCSPSPPTGR
jgi:hypothetical protein